MTWHIWWEIHCGRRGGRRDERERTKERKRPDWQERNQLSNKEERVPEWWLHIEAEMVVWLGLTYIERGRHHSHSHLRTEEQTLWCGMKGAVKRWRVRMKSHAACKEEGPPINDIHVMHITLRGGHLSLYQIQMYSMEYNFDLCIFICDRRMTSMRFMRSSERLSACLGSDSSGSSSTPLEEPWRCLIDLTLTLTAGVCRILLGIAIIWRCLGPHMEHLK